MEALDYAKLGFRCGLEIHQQLATSKLFCRCSTEDPPAEPGPPAFVIHRRLRPTQSELGEVDAAALQESRRNRRFEYHGYHGRACLVEADEEPPNPASEEALDVALTMAALLQATPVDEVQWMRKIVIDGSNTSGFQRTGLIALGGEVDGVGVQTLALEEDSCQRLSESADAVAFGLDRLGIPLIEIATAPTIRDGNHARAVAARIGALLRATGRVKRGIGTIRQDLNVSIRGGARIEVKGVQELNSIPRVTEWEVRRQLRLLEVAEALAKRGVKASDLTSAVVDLGDVFAKTQSTVVKKTLQSGGAILGVRLPGFHGLIGAASKDLPRLGRELSVYARRDAGVGGILHGDELPGMGVAAEEVASVRSRLACKEADSFVLVADQRKKCEAALRVVLARAVVALRGVPEEVRAAEQDDSTTYLRPLPGAARMYPETDVPPVAVSPQRMEKIRGNLPPPPEAVRERVRNQFHISEDEARQIVDGDMVGELAAWAKLADGPAASRVLLLILPDLRRRYPKADDLRPHAADALAAVKANRFAKEGVALVLEEVAAGRAKGVEEAVTRLGLGGGAEAALAERARAIVGERADFVRERGAESVGPLMGLLMKEFRGKVDGGQVSRALAKEVDRLLKR
ncbi:MAG: Glu-tRNA(Gln) amidotransferase subunit GatE [Euryarchaeota archaeon]|nr:Glu-tRNA(Gln) amidotransferase subunit GatE [Euryarchaeota archaeon]